jgi:hypothetical protein
MAPRGLGALLLAVLLPSCGGDNSSGGFQAPRETSSSTNLNSGGGDRFTMPPLGSGGNGMVSGAPGVALEWEVPPGWTELPLTSMRAANFRVAGNEKAECYLVLLGGDSGGLASNIDRWRSQISLPGLPPAELASLPHAMLLGRDGVVVDCAGTWKGMGGTENEAGWRLVGIMQVDVAGSAFFKMYGPDALIAAEKEHFLALARSIRPSHAGFGADPNPGQPAPGPAPMPADPNNPAAASMAGQQQGFTWMAPGTWTKGLEKSTRAVTYATPGGGECYVSVIPGDANGIEANMNRWRGQLGVAALAAGEVEKLEHLSICGADGRMITIEGAGDSAGKGMLGALALVGGRSVFVKLTGPRDAVQKEAENFKAFAQSLKEAK